MSKYIIDIPKTVGVLEAVGSVRYTYFDGIQVQTIVLKGDEIEELNSDYINEHFGDLQDTAYKKGLHDGESKCRYCNEYQRGLEEGKALSERGCVGCKYAGSIQGSSPCYNCSNYYKNNWTAKADKIEVGDEVEWDNDFTGDRFIVTRIYQPYGKKEQCDGIDDDGDVYRAVLIESLVKTGRHFDIASILEAMRHD